MVYQFASGYRLKGDPDVVGKAFEKIRAKRGLTAKAVLEEARDKKHPLHRYFEWDDKVAAESYRLSQAHYLIRAVVQVEEEETRPVRAFVRVSNETDYSPVMEVLSDAKRRQRLILDVQRDIDVLKEKLRGFEDLADLIEMLDMVDVTLRNKYEEQPEAR